jgi:hypothetical protein
MQTFLPNPDFIITAKKLDYRRLGKQRVEAKQILMVLDPSYEKKGWRNHPAVKMWRGYEAALAVYGMAICEEWIGRGYNDSLYPWFSNQYAKLVGDRSLKLPVWLGDPKFHRSHRSNLLRKQPEHYRKFWPSIPDDLPYIWPVL